MGIRRAHSHFLSSPAVLSWPLGRETAKPKATTNKKMKQMKMEKGKGKGKGYNKHHYQDHDRQVARGWYSEHEGHLPPGLAKKDRLPPGLQRQLDARGTLPPGLQKRIQPVPRDLEVRLAPPPPECEHVVIGGNIVLSIAGDCNLRSHATPRVRKNRCPFVFITSA